MKKGLIYAPISLVRKIKNSVDELKIHKAQLQNEGITYPEIDGYKNYVDANGTYYKAIDHRPIANCTWDMASEGIFRTYDIITIFNQRGASRLVVDGFSNSGNVEIASMPNHTYQVLTDGYVYFKATECTTLNAFLSAFGSIEVFYILLGYQTWKNGSLLGNAIGCSPWNPQRNYMPNDLVTYNCRIYRDKIQQSTIVPTDTTYWEEVSLASLSEKVYKNRLRSRVDISSMTSYTPETDGYVYILNGSSTTKTLSIDGYIGLGGTVGNFSMFVKGGCSITVSGSGGSAYFSPLSY